MSLARAPYQLGPLATWVTSCRNSRDSSINDTKNLNKNFKNILLCKQGKFETGTTALWVWSEHLMSLARAPYKLGGHLSDIIEQFERIFSKRQKNVIVKLDCWRNGLMSVVRGTLWVWHNGRPKEILRLKGGKTTTLWVRYNRPTESPTQFKIMRKTCTCIVQLKNTKLSSQKIKETRLQVKMAQRPCKLGTTAL